MAKMCPILTAQQEFVEPCSENCGLYDSEARECAFLAIARALRVLRGGSDRRIVVTEEVTCPECDGRGVHQHPAWREYWEVHAGKETTPEQDVEWFRASGWCPDARRYSDLPPEEELCGECEGRGTIRREVKIKP